MSLSFHPLQSALAAETAAHAAREEAVSASSRARGAKYAALRVAPAFYGARLGLAVEHGAAPGGKSRAGPDEVLWVFTLLDPADPGREGVLGIRCLPKKGAAAGAGGAAAGEPAAPSTSRAPAVASEKAVAVTRCEPPLPGVLPGLQARLADPADSFGMRELVIGVRRGFVDAFAAEKKKGGGRG